MREIRYNVKSVNCGIIFIAEELPDNWWVTKEDVGSNWGGDWHAPFDSQWADQFRDNLFDVLAGAQLNKLYSVFRDFGDSWHDPLVYVEFHDEVGNEDKRVAKTGRDGKGWEMCQISATETILAKRESPCTSWATNPARISNSTKIGGRTGPCLISMIMNQTPARVKFAPGSRRWPIFAKAISLNSPMEISR